MKIIERLKEIDGEPTDRLFLDRMYTIKDYQCNMYVSYAKENGWLIKGKTGYSDNN